MRLGLLAGAIMALVAAESAAVTWPGLGEGIHAAFEEARSPEARIELLDHAAGAGAAEAAPLIRAALGDGDARVRVRACEVAVLLDAVEVTDALAALWADPSAPVRAAALAASAALRDPAADGAATRLLGDADATVRLAAVRALGELAPRGATLSLSAMLRDRSRDVVIAALGALATLGDPAALYAVSERVGEPVEEVAIAAIQTAAALGPRMVLGALVEQAHGRREATAIEATRALEACGAPCAASLVGLLQAPRPASVRAAASSSLAALRDVDAAAAVLPLLSTEPQLIAPIFSQLGAEGWEALRAAFAAADRPTRRELLPAWLASGDPAAVDAAVAAGSDGVALLPLSPTPQAVCAAHEAGLAVDDWWRWAGWAADADAFGCASAVLDGASAVPPGALALLLGAFGAAHSAWAVEQFDANIHLETLGYQTGAPLVAALASIGETGAVLLVQLMGSADARIRREAALVLAELPWAWSKEQLLRHLAVGTRGPEAWLALSAGTRRGDDAAIAAAVDALGRGDAEAALALEALAWACAAPSRAVDEALHADDLWTRRAAGRYAAVCRGAADAVASPTAGDADADGLARTAVDRTAAPRARIAALRDWRARVPAGADPAWLASLRRDRAHGVVAAAWLCTRDADLDEIAAAVRRASHPAVAAAIALSPAVAAAGDSAVVYDVRRRFNAVVRREAGGATVSVIGDDGAPARDVDVFVLHADGSFDTLTTGRFGQLPLPPGPGPAVVFVAPL